MQRYIIIEHAQKWPSLEWGPIKMAHPKLGNGDSMHNSFCWAPRTGSIYSYDLKCSSSCNSALPGTLQKTFKFKWLLWINKNLKKKPFRKQTIFWDWIILIKFFYQVRDIIGGYETIFLQFLKSVLSFVLHPESCKICNAIFFWCSNTNVDVATQQKRNDQLIRKELRIMPTQNKTHGFLPLW